VSRDSCPAPVLAVLLRQAGERAVARMKERADTEDPRDWGSRRHFRQYVATLRSGRFSLDRGELVVSVTVCGKSGGHVAAEALDQASFDMALPGEWAIDERGPGSYALVPYALVPAAVAHGKVTYRDKPPGCYDHDVVPGFSPVTWGDLRPPAGEAAAVLPGG
jgi:hypothetical protein